MSQTSRTVWISTTSWVFLGSFRNPRPGEKIQQATYQISEAVHTADDLKSDTLSPELAPLTYVCGPTGFVETVSRSLTSLGHAPETIRTERFGGN